RAEESVHARAECERFVERPTEPLEIAVLDYPHNIDDVDLARAQPFDHVEVPALQERPDAGSAPPPPGLPGGPARVAGPPPAEPPVGSGRGPAAPGRPDRRFASAPLGLAGCPARDAESPAAETLVADLDHVGACTTRHQLALVITVRARRKRSSASRLMRYSLLLPVPMSITPSPKAFAAIRSWTCWTEQSSSSATAETRSQVYAAISCAFVRMSHLVTIVQIHHAAAMIAAHIATPIASPTRHPAAGPIGASYSSGSTGSNVGGGITAGRIRLPASATPRPPSPSRTARPRARRVRRPASRPMPAR